MGRKHLTLIDKLRLAEMWRAGMKREVIAAELNVTDTCIAKARRRMGLAPRRSFKPVALVLSSDKLAEAWMLWRRGRDTTQIASRLRVCEAAVYNSISNERERRYANKHSMVKISRGDAPPAARGGPQFWIDRRTHRHDT